MKRIRPLLDQMKQSPRNVRFLDLCVVCNYFFGSPRQKGTSHCIFNTPWIGDPRINIQPQNGKAKPYQVMQVLDAIEKLEKLYGTEN